MSVFTYQSAERVKTVIINELLANYPKKVIYEPTGIHSSSFLTFFVMIVGMIKNYKSLDFSYSEQSLRILHIEEINMIVTEISSVVIGIGAHDYFCS